MATRAAMGAQQALFSALGAGLKGVRGGRRGDAAIDDYLIEDILGSGGIGFGF